MAVTLISQLLVSAVLAAAAPADAAPKTCVSPAFDPATDCKLRPDVHGRAILECTAMRDGTLKDCVLLSETPEGQGIGAAALNNAQGAQIKADDSRPEAGARVRVPFRVG